VAPDILALLADPEVRGDPFPLFRQLRESAPVQRTTAGFYLVSRHTDAVAVLKGTGRDFVHPRPQEDALARAHPSHRLRLNSLLGLNGHRHRELRRIFAPAFAPRRIEEYRTSLTGLCVALVEDMRARILDGETVDVNDALARPLAFRSVAGLVGIPPDEQGRVADLVDAIAVGYEAADPARLTAADEPAEAFARYVVRLVDERARYPRDDMASALAAARGDDEAVIGDDEIAGTMLGVLMGGLAPAAAAICLGIRTLIERPYALPPLAARNGSSGATAFVDELLRHDGIVNFTALPRLAIREIALSGGVVPEGADVRVAVAAANRDPAAFPDPDRFDPARDLSAAITFSGGPHRCLAPGLARSEIATVLEAVASRLGGAVLAAEPELYDSVRVRALRSLRIVRAGFCRSGPKQSRAAPQGRARVSPTLR